MRTVVAVVTLLFSVQIALAQAAITHYSTSAPDYTVMTGVASDLNGGTIYCGTIGPTSFRNLLVMRMDSAGQILWQYTFPDALSLQANTLHVDSTGIYLAGSAHNVATTSVSGFTAHLSMNGTLLWRNRYNIPAIADFAPSPDGNYVAVSDRHLFKLDSTGTILWSSTHYSQTLTGNYRDLMIDSTGAIYALGSIYGSSSPSYGLVVKSDPQGNVLWSNAYSYGTAPSGWFGGIATDSALLLYGWSTYPASPSSYNILRIVEIDGSGAILRTQSTDFGQSGSVNIYASVQSGPNTLVLAGTRDVAPMIASFDLTTFQMNNGVYMPGSVNGRVFGICTESNGTIKYAGGIAASPAATDPFFFGQMTDSAQFGCGWSPFSVTYSVQNTSPSSFSFTTLMVVTSTSFMGSYTTPALSIHSCTSLTDIPEEASAQLNIFPNPCGNQCVVQLSAPAEKNIPVFVYNLAGEIVMQEFIVAGTAQLELNLTGLCAGSYFIQAEGLSVRPLQVIGD